MISQEHITSATPMGATLVSDGATFRVWAPRAQQIFVNGVFGRVPMQGEVLELLLAKDPRATGPGSSRAPRTGICTSSW
jgi:hypothetical protein